MENGTVSYGEVRFKLVLTEGVAEFEPRFRPNVVFSGASQPWAEDHWQDVLVAYESESPGRISVLSRCMRCQVRRLSCLTGYAG